VGDDLPPSEPGGLLSRRTTVTDVAGGKTTYEYTQGGRESVITDPSGRRTAVQYDPDLNRALSVIGPQGIRHSYQYDRSGQLLSETDALRQTTRYRYDPAGLLREVTDGAGRRVRFDYDTRGNRVAVTAADGTATRDVYDARGQIVERVDDRRLTLPATIRRKPDHRSTLGRIAPRVRPVGAAGEACRAERG
jgi:YD repeat-containing protein